MLPGHDGERAVGAAGREGRCRPRLQAHVQHPAGAEGDLDVSGPDAAGTHQRCLLVTDESGDRRRTGQIACLGQHAAAVDDAGQAPQRNTETLGHLRVPGDVVLVDQAGDGGVGGVGDVLRAAGQVPDEP